MFLQPPPPVFGHITLSVNTSRAGGVCAGAGLVWLAPGPWPCCLMVSEGLRHQNAKNSLAPGATSVPSDYWPWEWFHVAIRATEDLVCSRNRTNEPSLPDPLSDRWTNHAVRRGRGVAKGGWGVLAARVGCGLQGVGRGGEGGCTRPTTTKCIPQGLVTRSEALPKMCTVLISPCKRSRDEGH